MGNEAAENIASLKKSEMAKAAEKPLQGKGWLSPVLRMPQTALMAIVAE
ncbi:hypothetical protein OZ411_41725 [Bradyrhizobium sp. Arg237L]|nr:hypothetical protein [Bradyrhizobium sp. Arg237L]MDI4239312.1 hypothetical protein [Bradyrhizobium sp. Arg237L]